MATITIVREDNRAYLDDEWRTIDVSELDSDIHQIVWDDVAKTGLIFYVPGKGKRQSVITDFSPYQIYRTRFDQNPPPIITPPTPPTDNEQIDARVASPFDRGLIAYLASKFPENETAIIAQIKALK